MKHRVRLLSLLLACLMVLGVFLTACTDGGKENDTTEGSSEIGATEGGTQDDTEDSGDGTDSEGGGTDSETDDSDSETEEKETEETETEDPRLEKEYAPKLYFSAKDIYEIAKPGEYDGAEGFRRVGEVTMDEEGKYVRINAIANGASDANFPLMTERAEGAPYLAVKYRTKTQNVSMEFFLDSVNTEAVAGSSFNVSVEKDGRWRLAVINAEQKIAAYDGVNVNYIRFDFLNTGLVSGIPEGAYMEIEYIGFFSSVEDAEKFEYGEDYVRPEFTIAESSGYKLTTLKHVTCLDTINGMGIGGAPTIPGGGGNSKIGAQSFDHSVSTINREEGNYIFISGWTVVEGGFSKIVWSVDGGETWNDCEYFGIMQRRLDGNSDHIEVVDRRLGETGSIKDVEASVKGCRYQCPGGSGENGGGFAANLSAYLGKSVNIAFAAVPNTAPDELCPIAFIVNAFVGDLAHIGDEEPEEEESVSLPVSDFGDSIEEAERLSNAVNVYFGDGDRTSLVVENSDVVYSLPLMSGAQNIGSIKTRSGKTFLQNTSVPFVIGSDGKKYYASCGDTVAQTNIYRQGYYFYDVHVYGADFLRNLSDFSNEKNIFNKKIFDYAMAEEVSFEDGILTYKVTDASDPRLYVNNIRVATKGYQFIELTVRIEKGGSESGQLYVRTSEMEGFSADKVVNFKLIADGEFHTYYIPLYSVPGYANTSLTGLRLDVGSSVGEEISIRALKVMGENDLPTLLFDRTLYAYSDKVNQVMHLVSPTDNAISAYGWETVIPASSVAKLIVGDRKGDHTSLDGVDFASAKYVAFDIKGVGVLGYILLDHDGSGRLDVTLEDGNYVIRQTLSPKEKIAADSDIYMGHRLYTKETHSFDDFLFEAYCEYNPLEAGKIGDAKSYRYVSYDALRGAYKFEVAAGSWNYLYLYAQNRHYNLYGEILGGDKDRKIYVYTSTMGAIGTLECAVMLDGNGMIVPIPLEVCKNFTGDGEENVFLNDRAYSEVIFPLTVEAGSEKAFRIAHLYQNWGRYPLKQIDSIQFYAPFYHLSTGVTETNCIRPWYDMNDKLSLYTLPDFRAMSASLWLDIFPHDQQPQHTNGGNHQFLQYKGEDGEMVYSENIQNRIDSYGPTYAEIDMVYITDDGKIKVTYKHLEMPQTDENRTYYEITYEILEDLTIENVLKDFTFYTVAGRNMNYQHIGYLNEQNESVIVDTEIGGENVYVLGDECPYFSMFEFKETVGYPDLYEPEKNYVNLGCIIYNYDIKVDGKAYDGNFAIYENGRRVNLTLDIDGEATFRKGDKLTLNMILMPWGDGYGKTDYESDAPDINVRRVRENSALDPFTVTAGADCKVVDSVFLPRVMTTNGKSAEFTVSGGENNVTVRAYGFEKLARPVIYELVDGDWVLYEVNSLNAPDKVGNAHDYDGYMVQYDGDGNYSYSFVTSINDGEARTFRITVE